MRRGTKEVSGVNIDLAGESVVAETFGVKKDARNAEARGCRSTHGLVRPFFTIHLVPCDTCEI
jgi:hypothetical protein